MAYRLLNSPSDPLRVIRGLRLGHDVQWGLESGIELIWNAETVAGVSHAHGRALGLGVGLGLVKAVTPQQFNILAEIYTRAFEERFAVLTGQPPPSSSFLSTEKSARPASGSLPEA